MRAMTHERLSPERAARLLRAKAGELEGYVLSSEAPVPDVVDRALAADVALIAALLADHIEATSE